MPYHATGHEEDQIEDRRGAPAEIELTAGVSVRYPDADEPSPTRGRGDISGAPAVVAESLAAFAEGGYSHLMVWLGPMDQHGLDRLAESVALLRA